MHVDDDGIRTSVPSFTGPAPIPTALLCSLQKELSLLSFIDNVPA